MKAPSQVMGLVEMQKFVAVQLIIIAQNEDLENKFKENKTDKNDGLLFQYFKFYGQSMCSKIVVFQHFQNKLGLNN